MQQSHLTACKSSALFGCQLATNRCNLSLWKAESTANIYVCMYTTLKTSFGYNPRGVMYMNRKILPKCTVLFLCCFFFCKHPGYEAKIVASYHCCPLLVPRHMGLVITRGGNYYCKSQKKFVAKCFLLAWMAANTEHMKSSTVYEQLQCERYCKQHLYRLDLRF